MELDIPVKLPCNISTTQRALSNALNIQFYFTAYFTGILKFKISSALGTPGSY